MDDKWKLKFVAIVPSYMVVAEKMEEVDYAIDGMPVRTTELTFNVEEYEIDWLISVLEEAKDEFKG